MSVPVVLLTLGLLFLLGLAADLAGRFTPLPRVTLLLLAGLIIGPSGLDVLPAGFVEDWFELLTDIALSIVGFLLGQRVTVGTLRQRGHAVVWLTVGKVVGSCVAVAVTLLLMGVDARLALILAGIATATAPAATYDVVKESGARGEFTDTLLGIVALDDAWALLLFSLLIAAASALGGESSALPALAGGLLEVGGSLLLGLLLGVPMAYMTGRIKSGEPTQAEAFGLVLLCSGAALSLHLSPILAAMMMGSTVASFASHHTRPFHAIEEFEWPFMILFFILAGASLHLNSLASLGWMGIAYILARGIGQYLGIGFVGRVTHASAATRRWMGFALLPQAGVALGMALMASQRFDDLAHTILSVVLASTVALELVAPFVTRRVLVKVGEVGRRAG